MANTNRKPCNDFAVYSSPHHEHIDDCGDDYRSEYWAGEIASMVHENAYAEIDLCETDDYTPEQPLNFEE